MNEWNIIWSNNWDNDRTSFWLYQNNNLTNVLNEIDLILNKKQKIIHIEKEMKNYIKNINFYYEIKPIHIKILIYLLQDFTFNKIYFKILKTLQKYE